VQIGGGVRKLAPGLSGYRLCRWQAAVCVDERARLKYFQGGIAQGGVRPSGFPPFGFRVHLVSQLTGAHNSSKNGRMHIVLAACRRSIAEEFRHCLGRGDNVVLNFGFGGGMARKPIAAPRHVLTRARCENLLL